MTRPTRSRESMKFSHGGIHSRKSRWPPRTGPRQDRDISFQVQLGRPGPVETCDLGSGA